MALEEAPPFWWTKPGPLAWLLSPASFVWGWVSARRMALPPKTSVKVPVLCVGNFIVGGAGKTPTAIALAKAAKRRGLNPGFLSRGYGGRLMGPVLVDPKKHRAADTGDEPLLLAREAMTVISADRPSGAEYLVAQGCKLVIMDDGFQNPTLAKDFSVVVIDAKRGIGNGWTMPAGPMRAPLASQLALAGAIVVIGDAPGADRVIRETARRGKPFHLARTAVTAAAKWKNRSFIAYAGIADPAKFFASLMSVGANLVGQRPFPDHHGYTQEEARDLLERAKSANAELVTTAKDHVRLAGLRDDLAALAVASNILEITLQFDDPRSADLILDAALRNAEARNIREKTFR